MATGNGSFDWRARGEPSRGTIGLFLVTTFLLIGLGFVVGAVGSISIPLGFGVNGFWIGITVQQVGAIWFGGWGILAALIFPFFSNAMAGASLVLSLAYIPANFLQAFLPAFLFRRFSCDPRLRTLRDWATLMLAMLVSNALGALWGAAVLSQLFSLVGEESVYLFFWGWFAGNTFAGAVFNFLILRLASPFIIDTPLLVRGWWR